MERMSEAIDSLKLQIEHNAQLVAEGARPTKYVTFACKLPVYDVEVLQRLGKASGTTKGTVGAKLLSAAVADVVQNTGVVVDFDEVDELEVQAEIEEDLI